MENRVTADSRAGTVLGLCCLASVDRCLWRSLLLRNRAPAVSCLLETMAGETLRLFAGLGAGTRAGVFRALLSGGLPAPCRPSFGDAAPPTGVRAHLTAERREKRRTAARYRSLLPRLPEPADRLTGVRLLRSERRQITLLSRLLSRRPSRK